jgi:hypothetical protein
MEKKLIIKEMWLLDENGNRSLQLIQHDQSEVFKDCVDLENIRGGVGKNELLDNKSE